MDFLELANKRQSQRGYSDREVEQEKIERCIEAVRIAPSACNSQPWHFVVVDNAELKNKVAAATSNKLLPMNHFTNQAPVIVAIVNEGSNLMATIGKVVRKKQYDRFDIGIAAEHFCLQATSEGLSTCMLGWFNEDKVRKLINVPKSKRIELLITVGYPDTDDLRDKKRKTTENIRSYNSYSK